MKKLFGYLTRPWMRFVLVVLPLCIIATDAAVLVAEWRQPDPEKAIRLVRESKSRKENFTVQQYLYATVYHYRDNGEAITIDGWRVEPYTAATEDAFLVSFTFTDAEGQHVASWQAD